MVRKGMMIALLGVAALVVAGCEKSSSEKTSNTTASSESSTPLPAGLLLTAAPAEIHNVVEAKEKAKAGEDVVVQGVIGGRQEPFVEGRAIFQLVDSSLPTCDKKPEDTCKTPWDYCCETPEHVTAKSLTVQVVGADGKPLKLDLNGKSGLKPGAHVVVKGKMAEKTDDKNVIVHASGLFVQS